ncbi:hypothetical protein UFOVP816_53 [uncultured Caudovirales phage]|uniref:Uncharacterized protein n=1 Tax=uncultured Caudovirales phage TaxID=2100421 RepID=A0A6J5P5E8_9CAUD|nr:hypothetical protein UFOVP816_53 [uncultured Caudovirales phage]
MTEYSRMAKGYSSVLASGGCAPVNLPFQPDYVEFINYTAMDTPTATWIVKGYWDKNMGQGFAAYDFYDAGPVYSTNVATSLGVNTFAAGLALQYGAKKQVVSITKASPAVVTVTGHGYSSGDVVVFQGLSQSATTGMQQIAEIPFTITVIDANSFSIPFNTNQSNFTALSASPTNAFVMKVLYPFLYAPGVAPISAITLGTTTTIDTTVAHNFVVGQEVAFRIPNAWGTIQLNSLPNVLIPGSPIYGYVVAVTDYNTVVVNIDSSAFTAFNSNQPYLSFTGQQFAQIVAVGDVNTGGVQISAGSQLYPPPFVRPIANTTVNSINGPAIQGAYFNNTSQGFIIGPSLAVAAQSGQTIYWRAYLHDISVPV